MTASAVSLDLTKAFETVSHAILGSLSNDDGAQRERQKKKIDLLSKTITLHVQHNFFVHFFAITPRLRRGENA